MPRILLIDDQEDLLMLTSMLLEVGGYIVASARDANAALRLFAGTDYDVVITDYNMPGMNGDELAGRLNRIRPIRALVVMSARIEKRGGNKALREAFCSCVGTGARLSFVPKPYEADDLLKALVEILKEKPPQD